MLFAEDFEVYFAELGQAATLAGQPVRGMFDDESVTAPLGARGMAGIGPTFTLASARVPSGAVGAALVIEGHGNWSVAEVRHDGTGLCTLVLERAA